MVASMCNTPQELVSYCLQGLDIGLLELGGMDGLLPNTETGHFLSVLFSLMMFTAVVSNMAGRHLPH